MEKAELRAALIAKLSDLVELRVPEAEEEAHIADINRLSPDPSLLEYVYHPHLHFEDGFEPSVEEAVDRAMSYRRITL